VSNHNRSGRKPAGPFNWLEWLDRKAARLPRATGWTSPDEPFMLARYPHLRPAPIPGDVHSRIMCESEEKTAAQQFAEWESRIAGSAEAAVCLAGLSAEQRTQIAALLLQTAVDLEMREADSRSSQWARHLRREAPTRLRELNRRLQKARRAVEELKAYAEDSRAEGPKDMERHWARHLLGFNYRLAADKALRALVMKCPPEAQEFAKIAGEYPTPERVGAFGMVQLYWFFRHECKLSGHESEVRAARLRNAFWTEFGISKVPYRKTLQDGQHRGCGAVHAAIVNYRP